MRRGQRFLVGSCAEMARSHRMVTLDCLQPECRQMTDLLKTAVSYARVSSEKQLRGDGPERQADKVQRFAEVAGYTLAQSFVEPVSGTKDSINRPGFQNLLEYCRQTGISTIIVECMDRWARDLIVGELLLIQCRQLGLTVIDASTGNTLTDESDDPDVKLMRQMLLLMAQYERDKLTYRMRVARKRIKQRNGKCEGRKGYLDNPKFPQGPKIVARARELRGARMKYRDIAVVLTREGWPTMSGKPWSPGSVQSMLAGRAA